MTTELGNKYFSQLSISTLIEKNPSSFGLSVSSYELSNKKNTKDNFKHNNNAQNNNNSSLNKPYLPKLPEKLLNNRLAGSHLINDYYVNTGNKDRRRNKSKLNNLSSLSFKGDLLKGAQVYLALNSNNMSRSMKHIKTSDSPWCPKELRELTIGNKPCRSALTKTSKLEISNFLSNYKRANSTMNNNNLNSNITTSLNSYTNSVMKMNTLKEQELNDRLAFHLNNQNRPTVKIEYIANDMLLESVKRVWLENNKPANIALHALGTIWEIHELILENSSCLFNIYKKQLENETESNKNKTKLENSKEKSFTNISREYLEKMKHIYLEIDDSYIDKNSFAITLANLYHLDQIVIPDRLIAGTLAAAHYLDIDKLKSAACDKLSHYINKKNASEYYKIALKYKDERAIKLCESWFEMQLIHQFSNNIHLKNIPLKLLTKTIKSSGLFTTNEFSIFMILIYWTFLYLNPDLNKLPPESIIITYFTSFSKQEELLKRNPELKEAFYLVRLHGITKPDNLLRIQQMNIYPETYIVNTMLEMQHSLNHGGDMSIYRGFENSAIRQGFVFNLEENFRNEIFSLHGFNFELIVEKTNSHDEKLSFELYAQRIPIHDPIITYEKNQLETFSLRSDRFCKYSINVQYWQYDKRVIKSTGIRKHQFGKEKSKKTPSFNLDIMLNELSEVNDNELDEFSNYLYSNNYCVMKNELFVLFSFIFPSD